MKVQTAIPAAQALPADSRSPDPRKTRMNLFQVETFYWVARLGSFHAAARHLHLTQPTISVRIRELETSLGFKLFERRQHRAQITPAGRDVLAQAEKMLRLADEIERLGSRRDLMRGLLRLGANESTALAGLTELLARLKANYPALRIEMTIDVGATLSRKLNARELDIAILTDPTSSPHVVDEAIGWADFQWVASSCLVLPKRELTPADVASLQIVTISHPSTLNAIIAEWLRSGGVELENVSTCNSLSLMVRLVAAGHAVAVLPPAIVRAEIDAGIIRVLPAKPLIPRCAYYVSYLREEHGPEVGVIVQTAREVLAQSGLLGPQ